MSTITIDSITGITSLIEDFNGTYNKSHMLLDKHEVNQSDKNPSLPELNKLSFILTIRFYDNPYFNNGQRDDFSVLSLNINVSEILATNSYYINLKKNYSYSSPALTLTNEQKESVYDFINKFLESFLDKNQGKEVVFRLTNNYDSLTEKYTNRISPILKKDLTILEIFFLDNLNYWNNDYYYFRNNAKSDSLFQLNKLVIDNTRTLMKELSKSFFFRNSKNHTRQNDLIEALFCLIHSSLSSDKDSVQATDLDYTWSIGSLSIHFALNIREMNLEIICPDHNDFSRSIPLDNDYNEVLTGHLQDIIESSTLEITINNNLYLYTKKLLFKIVDSYEILFNESENYKLLLFNKLHDFIEEHNLNTHPEIFIKQLLYSNTAEYTKSSSRDTFAARFLLDDNSHITISFCKNESEKFNLNIKKSQTNA